jgi:hypothetical protein
MLYRNGRYSVEVGSDGAIKVRHGDWLSKYSAAMFNNFCRVNEYGRVGRFGVVPLRDFNRIKTSETIYHIPTYLRSRPPIAQSPRPIISPLSSSQKKDLIKDTLAHDFHLRGDHLAVLGKAIDIIGYADNAMSLAEIAGLIAEGGILSGAATATSLVSTILFPVGGAIALVNAFEAGVRLATMAAVAYTITAWAFNDPIPELPARVQRNVQASFANEISAYQEAWKDASSATLRRLREMVAQRPGTSEKSFRVLFRAIGDDNRQILCGALLKGFEKNLTNVEKQVLKTFKYPN